MLAGVPIFMPEDAPLDVKEVPAEPQFTRDFVPEIEILQRERDFDSPAWMWGVANLIVLLCSLAILAGISVAVARVSRRIAEHGAGGPDPVEDDHDPAHEESPRDLGDAPTLSP
jgi:hypothetical protein